MTVLTFCAFAYIVPNSDDITGKDYINQLNEVCK